MKKNVLALSITAALVGLGSAGGALAALPVPQGNATQLRLSVDGTGHILLVPYFSAQGNNGTLLNITNTDSVNGKAVKVRFRGASNSDDIYDFQVFLSPADVWTAAVTRGSDGRATLTTSDNSCTKPVKSILNSNGFVTSRLKGQAAAQTLEGYVEILNMADVVPSSALYTAIVHSSSTSTPACSGSAWTALDTYGNTTGLTLPTTGLMANWIIINTTDAGAWSGAATAVAAVDSSGLAYATGNMVYSPQTAVSALTAMSLTSMDGFTADPLFRGTAPVIAPGLYDLPDLSTPYFNGAVAETQASYLSYSLATRNVINEFLTDTSINSTTDWTLSSVTRRYSVALNYTGDARVYTTLTPYQFYTSANTTVINSQICVTNITPKAWDREEQSPTSTTDVVISPSTPASPLVFCGEANVLAINNAGVSGTLGALIARSSVDNSFANTGKYGWMNIQTPGLGNGLPLQGSAFLRATSANGRYGVTWEHRTTRPQIGF